MSQLPPGFVLDGPAPASPTSPVYGAPPKPDKPDQPKTTYRTMTPDEVKAAGLNPTHGYQVSSEGKVDDLGETVDTKAAKAEDGKATTIGEFKRTLDAIDQAALLTAADNGWWETGKSGALVRSMPNVVQAGTDSKTLEGYLKTINANTAFKKLQEMRQNSPTGGAVGNVSDSDMKLLQSTISSIDPDQDQAAFFQNLATQKKAYLDTLAKLDPAAAQEYANKKGIRFAPDGMPILVSVDGQDNRKPQDPFGVLGGQTPPDGGNGGGPGGGLSQVWEGIKQGTGSMAAGVGDIAGIVGNPLNATINAATGSNLSTDLGGSLRDMLGLPQNTTGTDTIIRTGTGAAAGSLGARAAATVANPGAVQNALTMFGRAPVADTVAGAGSGAGADIARRNDLGPVGQVGGAVLGGMAGYGAVNALARNPAGGANALAAAADRQGVNMLPADAGGPATRIVTSATKASPISAGPVVKSAQAATGDLANAAARTAKAQGGLVDSEVAGTNIRNAAERFTKQTAERANRMYDRAYQMAGDARIVPAQTLAAIDEQLVRLSQNPAADNGTVKQLMALRESIANGVSVQGLRDARSALSQGIYDGKLRGGQEQAMFKQILGNVAADIEQGLRQSGKADAANAFATADKFWSARVEHIDKVLQPILGNGKSGEEVLQAVESMARGKSGGNARLSRLLSNMTPEEAGNVRAAIIDRIGKAAPGQQSAEGNAFSASTFLTNWNKMTPQAKGSLFGDQATRRDLDDIALLSERMKATQAMANHSNTGAAMAGNVGAQGALLVAHPVAAILGAGAQYVTGRLMASPGFARILLRTSKMPDGPAVRSLKDQLTVLGTREPLVRADAQALQQYLATAFGKSPVAAAANEKTDGR